MSALPLRLALADVLAAITDEPRGHWIARFADPSRRGEPTFVRGAVSMSFAVDRFRAPVRKNLTRLTITDPATAYEALISRGVLPDEWAGDTMLHALTNAAKATTAKGHAVTIAHTSDAVFTLEGVRTVSVE